MKLFYLCPERVHLRCFHFRKMRNGESAQFAVFAAVTYGSCVYLEIGESHMGAAAVRADFYVVLLIVCCVHLLVKSTYLFMLSATDVLQEF